MNLRKSINLLALIGMIFLVLATQKNSYGQNITSDGKLNLTGVTEANKKLFIQIYESEFQTLARQDKDEYVPYGLFSGLVANYSNLCRSSLSPSAVKVDDYAERYLGTEYRGFSQTKYYETYLAQTVYMEPKYEKMYGASAGIALLKQIRFQQKQSGTLQEKFFSIIENSMIDLVPIAFDSQQLVSGNKCGSPGILKFIDNLHKFTVGSWKSRADGDFNYTEVENTLGIRRNYTNMPQNFSPKFWVPLEENLEILINAEEPMREFGTRYGKTGLSEITINVIKKDDNLRKKLNMLIKNPTPQPILDALDNKKYLVAKCKYLWENGAFKELYYWSAKSPLPSLEVQTFLKDFIKAPRTECPILPQPNPPADLSGTWNFKGLLKGKPVSAKMIITKVGKNYRVVLEHDDSSASGSDMIIYNDTDFSGKFVEGFIENGKLKGFFVDYSKDPVWGSYISFTASKID